MKWTPTLPRSGEAYCIDHRLHDVTGASTDNERLTLTLKNGREPLQPLQPLFFEAGKSEAERFMAYLLDRLHFKAGAPNQVKR